MTPQTVDMPTHFVLYLITRSAIFLRSFLRKTIADWNQVNADCRKITSISIFKRAIRAPLREIPILLEKTRYVSV